MLRIPTLACCLFSLLAAAASAQLSSEESYGLPSSNTHTSASYPKGSTSAPQLFSSTLQEGVLRGRAAVMQAYYNGQISLAQARILMAEAVAREMQLPVVKTKAAQEKRRLIAAEWQEYRRQKLDTAILGGQLSAQRAPLRHATYRLNEEQFNRITGEIYWPLALTHEQFDADTFELDKLFSDWAQSPTAERSYLQASIVSCCERLQKQLRQLRGEISVDDEQYANYLLCYRYVLGLKYEAVGNAGLSGSMFTVAAQ